MFFLSKFTTAQPVILSQRNDVSSFHDISKPYGRVPTTNGQY